MDYAALFYELTGKRALYNIMPIYNIPSVIENGILSYNDVPYDHESIADPEVQLKRNKSVPGGLELHANLYFDPRNPMMYRRRGEYRDLCILGINAKILNIDGVVITDHNAASNFAKFLEPHEMQASLDFDIIYATDWNDPDEFVKMRKKSMKCSEVLVPYSIPYEYVVGAYVADTSVEKKLRDAGFSKTIKIDSYKFFKRGGLKHESINR